MLGYWLPGLDTYVDSDGVPVALPEPGSGRAATFVERNGEPVAALVHDAALAYEPELLEIVCATADVALERERLQAELRTHADELMGSRARIVEAGDAARKKIERDLHDGAQQRLVALALALRMAESRIQDDPVAAGAMVASAREELAASLAELRELAHGIHPAILELRPRPRAGIACDAFSAPRLTRARGRRAAPGTGRDGRVLRRVRGARQRRQVRERIARSRSASRVTTASP